MFWLERKSGEVLKKRELEETRGWMPMDDGCGCEVLLSDREMYLRVAVLTSIPHHVYHHDIAMPGYIRNELYI
jgi:hypothetical protein